MGNNVSSSDRLKKAIERNRTKVAQRTGTIKPSPSTIAPSMSNSSLSDRLAKLKEKRAQMQGSRLSSPASSSISRPSNSFSNSEAMRADPTVASKIELLKARRQNIPTVKPVMANDVEKPSAPGLGEKLVEKNFSFYDRIFSTAIQALLAKTLRVVIWGLHILFLGIAIFGERGVVDYISRHGQLVEKENEISFLVNENEDIKFQIHRLENETNYQKQVIRDYLGYISTDEYLVIFAENQGENSLPN